MMRTAFICLLGILALAGSLRIVRPKKHHRSVKHRSGTLPSSGGISTAEISHDLKKLPSYREPLLGEIDVTTVSDVLSALNNFTAEGVSESKRASWRSAQADMFERTAGITEWHESMNSSYLYDKYFFQAFSERFKQPDFYVGLVYIPLAWNFLVERAPRYLNSKEGYTRACELLQSLDPQQNYFAVMVQSHVSQFSRFHWGPIQGDCPRVNWSNILVFDSRGKDYDAWYPRIPIPLLRHNPLPARKVNKSKLVTFHGSCHQNRLRMTALGPGKVLGPGTLPGGLYAWNISACNEKIGNADFRRELYTATWGIAPAGSMPATFMLYEELQAGALAIIPYQPGKSASSMNYWLPYREIGVKWQHQLAELVPESEIEDVKNRIETISDHAISQRQAMLSKLQPLFRPEGLTAYILYKARKASQESTVGISVFQVSSMQDNLASLARKIDG
eukprot:gnl/TRDRNA2_/TRDRNA2_187351_c0_seq1.p1 gnl/TRDRNA2_/TRDRNA2_187351_c0~~gnl/TRDRNA2_/TRDRNA2_187351_c0_seq1.p1  ORF type:complete len:448 (+),score=30.69 gnl/TRDRNA2_/TRDRNA2_187351_c0_seq1:89-1432(+)